MPRTRACVVVIPLRRALLHVIFIVGLAIFCRAVFEADTDDIDQGLQADTQQLVERAQLRLGDGDGKWLKGDLHVHGPVGSHIPPDAAKAYAGPEEELKEQLDAFKKLITDANLERMTENFTKWPASIIPFPALVGKEELQPPQGDKNLKIWGDKLFDQAVVDWEYIFQKLKNKSFNFSMFLTHDLRADAIDSGWKEKCRQAGMICATGREYRQERAPTCWHRLGFTIKCAANGLHTADFRGTDSTDQNSQKALQTLHHDFIMSLHANARLQDRLDPEYYKNRQAGQVTGRERGTPCKGCPAIHLPHLEMTYNGQTVDTIADIERNLHAIEVWNGWFPLLDPATAPAGGELQPYGDFTPEDKDGTFAVNKWDAALSRGLELWAVASGDAFAKWNPFSQLKKLQEKGGDCDGNRDCAMDVRTTPVGGGFIKAWLSSTPTLANLVDALTNGHFYAATENNPSKAKEIVVKSVVQTRHPSFTVFFESDDGVECKVVTNHGRMHVMVPGRTGDREFTQIGMPALCGDKGQVCTYMRVECRRCHNAVQRADCAHVWFQPMYLESHQKLRTQLDTKVSEPFVSKKFAEKDPTREKYWNLYNEHRSEMADIDTIAYKDAKRQGPAGNYNVDKEDQCVVARTFRGLFGH